MIGKRLGPYEILEKVGAGGMGEVYRATDTRLGREVAVKVLPPGLSSDPDRLRRFEQEARSAGVLNHPNILAIHDIGTYEGSPYVVSELLSGQTLRDRLGGSALPPRKAIEYAIQIAHGLAAAHEKGIVHRDLKPENLFITPDGRVKILDFGLAKLTRPEDTGAALTNLPTTPARTDPGTVLGTAGYMSPEQVRGHATDHRSDIFSFGAILHEMVTGRRAFRRDSAVETMNAILKEDPPEISGTHPNIPPVLERIVRHCLEKSPAERFQSARDLAFDLEAISGSSGPALSTARPTGTSGRRTALLAGGLVLLLTAGALGYLAGVRGGGTSGSSTPTFRRLTFRRGSIWSARFAGDGQTILYGAAWDGKPIEIFQTRPESPESRSLGIADADLLSISKSGEMAILLERRLDVGWMSRGTLARAPHSGGAPREIAENIQDADWSSDGKDLALVRWGLKRYRLEFPPGTVLLETPGWLSHPRVSPRGDQVAVLEHPVQGDDGGSVVLVDRAGKKKILSSGWASVWGLAWSTRGDEIWFTATRQGINRSLQAVSLTGRHREILQVPGILTLRDLSRDGRVLLSVENARREMRGRRAGEPRERDLSWLEWSLPTDLTADGQKVLFTEQGAGGGPNYAAYIRGMDESPAVKLGEGCSASFLPDGKWAISVQSISPGRIALLPTGVGEPRPVDIGNLDCQLFAVATRDGRGIVFAASAPGHGVRPYVKHLEGGPPRAFGPEGVQMGYLSAVTPDGKFLAAVGPDEKGALYPLDGGEPQPLPGLGLKDSPLQWSPDGRFLFVFRVGDFPARVERLEAATGRRQPWKELFPSDPAGVVDIGPIVITPDGDSYVYGYKRVLSDLYIMTGLK